MSSSPRVYRRGIELRQRHPREGEPDRPGGPFSVNLAHRNDYRAVLSHRSGETEDTAIADIAVATNCGRSRPAPLPESEREVQPAHPDRRGQSRRSRWRVDPKVRALLGHEVVPGMSSVSSPYPQRTERYGDAAFHPMAQVGWCPNRWWSTDRCCPMPRGRGALQLHARFRGHDHRGTDGLHRRPAETARIAVDDTGMLFSIDGARGSRCSTRSRADRWPLHGNWDRSTEGRSP